MKYLEYDDTYWVIDIETDDLEATKIWCMCWQNAVTRESGVCVSNEDIVKFFQERDGHIFIGHNLLKFDAPTLNRLIGSSLGVRNCIDTLVLSTLYSPSIYGGHSLDAWGERLGKEKIHFNDWSGLSDKMVEYCERDVDITTQLFRRLIRTLARIEFSEQSIWIQHQMTVIIDRQKRNGFYFDGPRAIELYQTLRRREKELEDEIQIAFPPARVLRATREMCKRDGSPTAIYLKDVERYEVVESPSTNTYEAYESVPFNLGSPLQRVERLVALGWEPEEFTEKGFPKPFDKGKPSPSLERFLETAEAPEVKLFAKWTAFNGRANMVNTWLENWNDDDWCIHGNLFVADTLRFRHQSPNTANIPAVRVKEIKDDEGRVVEKLVLRGEDGYFTYEARDLWTARPGRVLVGTDAAGLELRMLAHYLNRPDFTESVVNGDPHQYNADSAGVSRPVAKTLIYAVLYGAGGPKIAKTVGLPVLTKKNRNGELYEVSPEGDELKALFLEKLGATELVEQCKQEQKNGRVSLVDGSQVICPSPHAALNYKLQGGGARVMALGCVLLERNIQRHGLDSLKVGDIHDEWQYDVLPDHSQSHAQESVEAIREAGRKLNLNVPLDGEAKEGLTWAETH